MFNRYEVLKQFSSLIEMGYSLNQAVLVLEKIYQDSFIKDFKKNLSLGYSILDSFKKLKMDKLWLEYFEFFYQNTSLSKAIDDSLMVVEMKDKLIKDLKKTFTYPLLLLAFAITFSLFTAYVLFPKLLELIVGFDLSLTTFQYAMFIVINIVPYLLLSIIIISSISCMNIIKIIYRQDKKRIHKFMKVKKIRTLLQLYFSIKFSVYYQQLIESGYDSKTSIEILRKKIGESDLKLVIDHIYSEIMHGKEIDLVINECIYLNDHLKVTYQIMLQNGMINQSLKSFINSSIALLERKIQKVIKILLPCIYGFVGMLVVMIYLLIVLPLMNIVSAL